MTVSCTAELYLQEQGIRWAGVHTVTVGSFDGGVEGQI